MPLPRPAYVVYLVGILFFGFFYEKLKFLIGPGWRFFTASIILLLVLRVVAELLERALRKRAATRASSSNDA